jgi:hypothetical protein
MPKGTLSEILRTNVSLALQIYRRKKTGRRLASGWIYQSVYTPSRIKKGCAL